MGYSYGYLVPNNNGMAFGKLVRFSLTDFSNTGVTVLDLKQVDSTLGGFVGGFASGGFAYVVPYYSNKLVGKVSLSLMMMMMRRRRRRKRRSFT